MFEQDWRLAAIAACGLLGGAYVLWLCAYRLWRRTWGRGKRARGRLLAIAIDNMTQGVVMLDAARGLGVGNEPFVGMYEVCGVVVKSGWAFLVVTNNREHS